MKFGIVIVFAALVSGCASQSPQPPKTSNPPTGDLADYSGAGPVVEIKEGLPNFSGHWVLNAKASDDPRAKLKDAIGDMKGPGGQGQARGGGGGGRGGGGGGMKGGRGQGSADAMPPRRGFRLEDIAFPGTSKTLDIAHTDPVMVVTYEDGRAQRIYTDFRGASISASGSLQQQVTTAGWERGALIVETTANNGQRLVQSYRVQADARQLAVETEILIPQLAEPVRIRQLYDPAGMAQ